MSNKATLPVSRDTKKEVDEFRNDYFKGYSYNDLIIVMLKELLQYKLKQVKDERNIL